MGFNFKKGKVTLVNPHILVIRLSAMGDVAMTVPVLRAIAQQYPNAKMTVVSRPFFEPLFDSIPNLKFFSVDLNERHNGIFGIYRLFSDLKKFKITHVADLHNVLRSKILRNLFAINGIKTAATDKGRLDKKKLTRPVNKVFKPLKTMFERHGETFTKLGFPIILDHPIFPETKVLNQEIKKIILYDNNTILIGIAPFAQYNSKVYPKDLMQKVIDGLALNPNYKILLFGGGQQEIQKLNKFKNNLENVIVVAGKLSFEQELILISNLRVMLSMDSGNAHIAAMFGIPVITLWGATHPFAGFSPFNQPFSNAILSDINKYPKLPTSVYGNKTVLGYDDVMRTIFPEKIIDKINEIVLK